jgi:prevent-host-death family protein
MNLSMQKTINASQLRRELGRILERVRRGERFTVLCRSRPVCQLVPVESEDLRAASLEDEPLYGAGAVGRSSDGRTAADHDEFLYGADER